MEWNFLFFFNSGLLGVGLAMDAFSVSMANGLHDPKMSVRRMCIIAGAFGVFQAVMPMTGWVCVHTIVELFSSFEMFIPWIALILLAYIGGKMLLEGIRGEETEEAVELSAGALFVQGWPPASTPFPSASPSRSTTGRWRWRHLLSSPQSPSSSAWPVCTSANNSAPSWPARRPSWAASSSSASVWRSSSPASSDGNVFTEPCIRKKIFRTCAAARPPAFSAQWPRNAGGLWMSCCVFCRFVRNFCGFEKMAKFLY